MKILVFVAGIFVTIAVLALFPAATGIDQLPIPSNSYLNQVVKPIDLNRDFDFGGESLPMSNDDVKQRLDRELLLNAYSQANMMMNLKRSGEVFPTIERILAEEGIPDDFKYLAVAESNLVNQATSSVGAKGVWQFMPGTGKEYNLEINDDVDERLNLEKATRSACKFIRYLYNRYGSWIMAAAAYNMGASGLNRDATAQKVDKYWDIQLNQETLRYVFRCIAIKDIMRNPEAYGFFIEQRHKYPEPYNFQTIEVNTSVPSWVEFAVANGSTLRLIKFYNPWIVGNSLSNKSGKVYQVRVASR